MRIAWPPSDAERQASFTKSVVVILVTVKATDVMASNIRMGCCESISPRLRNPLTDMSLKKENPATSNSGAANK